MKAKAANSKRLDIIGNRACPSDREIFAAVLKRWRQKLGYFSIFAAVPAMVISQVQAARTEEAKQPEASVAGRGARLPEKLTTSCSKPALLKRQSKFLLPHQKGNSDILAPLGGNDDCPGRPIPGGNYTAAVPYIDSGNTTGANNTVGSIPGYYTTYDASGPDHVYSFTLTGLGPNPQMEISTTSGTYKPLTYVLRGDWVPCPAGTGNSVSHTWSADDSRWYSGASTVTLDLSGYPLNVPFLLFVDSRLNDSLGAGPYTLRMQDATIAPSAACPNSIDCHDFFVRQHYLDFLNRAPDAAGQAFWTNEITSCGADPSCIDVKRINVSAAYFLSIEFQKTGYLVYRIYKSAYGDIPGIPVPIRLNEFLPDTQKIGQGVIVNQAGWEQLLENNKQAFMAEFVQRSRFATAYPSGMTPAQFVDQLFVNAGVTPSAIDRASAINEFGSSTTTTDIAARARALRRVAENATLAQQEFNRAFVLMQYFGYLRRNPNDPPEPTLDFQGYNFWLNKLSQFNGSFQDAEMVKAFLVSTEYRQRFAP